MIILVRIVHSLNMEGSWFLVVMEIIIWIVAIAIAFIITVAMVIKMTLKEKKPTTVIVL